MGRQPGGASRRPIRTASGARSDNPQPAPGRSIDVADPDQWQTALRRCLVDQATGAAPAPSEDLANRVIARGRRGRRRRTAGTLVAVMAATAFATGGLLYDGGSTTTTTADPGPVSGVVGDPLPVEPAEPATLLAGERLAADLGADLLGDGVAGQTVLATAAGDTVVLDSRIRQIRSAHRLDQGYAVVAGEPGAMRLWWVVRGQPARSVLTRMDAIVVAGDQVAWRRGGMLALATLTGPALTDRVTTVDLDQRAQPVDILGDAVLLGRPGADGATVEWGSWAPRAGDHQPSWTEQLLRVYGRLPGDAGLVGLVSGPGGSCLARLDAGLTPRQTRCLHTQISPDAPATISPDQRWLLVVGVDKQPRLVDLAHVFDAAAGPALVPVPEVTPVLVGAAAGGGAPAAEAAATTAAAEIWSIPVRSAGVVWPTPDRVVLTGADHLTELRPALLLAGAPDAVAEYPLQARPPVVVRSG